MLGMISVLASMLPEEQMIDEAIKELEKLKNGGAPIDKETGKTQKPMPALMMLVVKWRNEGKSTEEVMKESKEMEEESKISKALFDNKN